MSGRDSMGSTGKDPIKIMAELLKSGATMLSETCPVEGCNLPLFKLRSGEIVCPVHGRVYVAKTDEDVREIYSKATLSMLLDSVQDRAVRVISELIREEDVDATEIIKWLEVLERIERLKALRRGAETR